MSSFEDQSYQFQIPANDTVDVAAADNPHWAAADVKFVANNLTGSTILDDQPHDLERWHDALTYNERLGLAAAAADVERRQRETDFNESLAEATAVYHEAASAIEATASNVIDLRARFCNDDGTVNGVKAA